MPTLREATAYTEVRRFAYCTGNFKVQLSYFRVEHAAVFLEGGVEGEGMLEGVGGMAALGEVQVAAQERAVGGVRAVFHDAFCALAIGRRWIRRAGESVVFAYSIPNTTGGQHSATHLISMG